MKYREMFIKILLLLIYVKKLRFAPYLKYQLSTVYQN